MLILLTIAKRTWYRWDKTVPFCFTIADPYCHTSDWRLRLRLRLRLLTNRKEVDSCTLLSDWSRDANVNADAIVNC